MATETSPSIRSRLLAAEKKFLSAITSQGDDLFTFDADWSILCADVTHALDSSVLADEDIALAQSISSRIAIVGDGMLELNKAASQLSVSLMDTLQDMFASMSLQDEEKEAPSTSRRRSSTLWPNGADVSLRVASPHHNFTAAYEWLLRNTHNPYPTAPTKKTLAGLAGVSVDVMNDWFKTVRRRIGWVSICKTHFHGSRSLTIAAAERVFSDNKEDMDVPFEIAVDFLATRSKLMHLQSIETQKQCNTLMYSTPSIPRSTLSTSTSRDSLASLSTHSKNISVLCFSAPDSPSRPPSLVFSSSDSEEEDRLTELPAQAFVDNKSVWVASSDIPSSNHSTGHRKRRREPSDDDPLMLTWKNTDQLSSVYASPPQTSAIFDWWRHTDEEGLDGPRDIVKALPVSSRKRRSPSGGSSPPLKRFKGSAVVGSSNSNAAYNPLLSSRVSVNVEHVGPLERCAAGLFGKTLDSMNMIETSLDFDTSGPASSAISEPSKTDASEPNPVWRAASDVPPASSGSHHDSNSFAKSSPLSMTLVPTALPDFDANFTNPLVCLPAIFSTPISTSLLDLNFPTFATPALPIVDLSPDDQMQMQILLEALPPSSFTPYDSFPGSLDANWLLSYPDLTSYLPDQWYNTLDPNTEVINCC